jgi:hypothetical protein
LRLLRTPPLVFIEVTDELDPPPWQRFVSGIIGIDVECLAEAT